MSGSLPLSTSAVGATERISLIEKLRFLRYEAGIAAFFCGFILLGCFKTIYSDSADLGMRQVDFAVLRGFEQDLTF